MGMQGPKEWGNTLECIFNECYLFGMKKNGRILSIQGEVL